MKHVLYEEFVKRHNTHQTHFDDLVLLGPDGIDEIKDKVKRFFAKLDGEDLGLNTTVKVDGSPAVICFSKFPGYPDNSICLKSFVNNANNVLSSVEEIESRYGDRQSMSEKLVYCLELAKLIPEGEAWQGDCLFSDDDKHVENIRGKEYITFQPNKIVYAFSQENPGFEKVKNASFGIAFHTVYKDDGNGGKTQTFRPAIDTISWPDWAYIMSPALNVDKEKFNIDSIKEAYSNFNKAAQDLVRDPAYIDLVRNEVFMQYWNTFENANIADKKQTQLDVSTVVKDLKRYVSEKQTVEFQKKFNSLKTNKGKMNAIDVWAGAVAELKEIINYNQETIVNLVEALNAASALKMLMWEGFKSGASQDYSTFYKSKTKGIIDANMEGVAMSDAEGNIVKIVDRTEFSSANRDPDIMAGWEHPERNLSESKIDFFERLLESHRLSEVRLGISDLNYKNGEYTSGFKSFISDGKPLICSKTKESENTVSIVIEPTEELLNIEDTKEFSEKLEAAILAKDPTIRWVEKPKDASGVGSSDVYLNTDFQEAIQGYLFEKYWNSPLQDNSNYVETLFSEDFKERINWDICRADYEKFKSDIYTTYKKGKVSSNTWLSYFIAIAKTGAKKIKDLYREEFRPQGKPTVFARGLKCNIGSDINDFFSKHFLGKPKDRFNKSDVILVFGANPESIAREYISKCLTSKTVEDYCKVCDEALSNGSVLGLSLKKGKNEVHAELLATTTSINKEVFGENASTTIVYNGENDPLNTFTSFKEACNNPEFMHHIKDFRFEEYISEKEKGKEKQGLTSEIILPVNEDFQKSFSDYIKITIRTNDREKGSVTVEPYKHGSNAALGKWPTVMQEELGVSMPKKSKSLSKYEQCVEKINIFLSWFKIVYESENADLFIATFVSSGGYPLANNLSGETRLMTAPIIKIS